ncbi:MAG: GDP-mannose 4,6-dehydratase [Rubrobacter sp.]|nr:GDP-mannose 4,6-dehydratase [Rubrobacter sp.]
MRAAPGETFQIATNAETTVGELGDDLLPVLAAAGVKGVDVHYAARRPGDIRRNFSDTSKARAMLGWEARVGLEERLRHTVAFCAERMRFGGMIEKTRLLYSGRAQVRHVGPDSLPQSAPGDIHARRQGPDLFRQ